MSLTGGAASWYSRRDTAPAAEDELSEIEEYEELYQIVDDEDREDGRPAQRSASLCQPCEDQSQSLEPDSITMTSQALYEAVQEIYTPTNEVKQKTGELLLKAHRRGQYQLFTGIDLDAEMLEHAGHLPSTATPVDRELAAKKLAEDACSSRCGDMCTGDCLIVAYVVAPGYGTEFYFGSHEDVVLSVITHGATCDVFIWDELEHHNMKQLNGHLDMLLETVSGLAMRKTELKTVPGQVLYHCDVAAWMKFCLEHPKAAPQLRFQSLQGTDSRGNCERQYGAPCTSMWQQEMEAEYFPDGLPEDVDIVGCMHAIDVSDVQHDGSRKSGNVYGAPAGLSNDLRGDTDVWSPLAYLPQWKHPNTDGLCHPVEGSDGAVVRLWQR